MREKSTQWNLKVETRLQRKISVNSKVILSGLWASSLSHFERNVYQGAFTALYSLFLFARCEISVANLKLKIRWPFRLHQPSSGVYKIEERNKTKRKLKHHIEYFHRRCVVDNSYNSCWFYKSFHQFYVKNLQGLFLLWQSLAYIGFYWFLFYFYWQFVRGVPETNDYLELLKYVLSVMLNCLILVYDSTQSL